MCQVQRFPGLVALSIVILVAITSHSHGLPVEVNTLSAEDIIKLTNNSALADILSGNFSEEESGSEANKSKEVFVIKAVVYEVGILTEVDDGNDTFEDSEESNERLDLTFFQTHKNGSVIDLGDIPLPIEANISGHSYTQILPFHVGQIHNVSDILSVLPLPEHILNFTNDEKTSFNYTETPLDTYLPVENSTSQVNTLVDKEDLLKIPHIGETILIDADFGNDINSDESADSSSSSEEEDKPSVIHFNGESVGI